MAVYSFWEVLQSIRMTDLRDKAKTNELPIGTAIMTDPTSSASDEEAARSRAASEREEIATAYHEAGHAVMALSLGRPVEKVTIVRNSIRLGQCQMSNRRGAPVKDELEVQALILFAGVVCEARYTGQYNWGGATQDMIGIRRLSRYRGATERQSDRIQQRWLDKTEHLMDEALFAVVDKVAKELLEKRSMSGRAVQQIFQISYEE